MEKGTTSATYCRFSICLTILLFVFSVTSRVSLSVRVLGIDAPQGILLNARTEVVCNFDLENDTLYTLNWFLNGSEIASIRPNKQPVIELYPLPYLDLSINQSFSNKLVIGGFKSSGMYQISCEVTVHNSFQLESAQADIRVIVPPTSSPSLTGFNPFGYHIHDVMNVSCSAPSSDPPPQLDWLINDQLAPETSVKSTFLNNTQISILTFKIDMNHLLDGVPVIKLKCLASLQFNSTLIFEKSEETDVSIENEETLSTSSKVVVRYSNNNLILNERANFTCLFKGTERVQLYWLINGQRVDPRLNILYPFPDYLGLSFIVDKRFLDGSGKMRVKCVARKVFWRLKSNNSYKPNISVLLLLILSTFVQIRLKKFSN